MTAKLSVVETLYDSNASNVPAMLRQAAASIESETDDDDRTKAMVAVQLSHDGTIAIYAWGAVDRFTAIGALQAGVAKACGVVREHQV